MLRHLLIPCLLTLLILPASAAAQEAAQERTPAQEVQDDQSLTLVVSQWKCDWRHVGDIVDGVQEVMVPTWDGLVEDGHLISAGLFIHEWGDEWNVNMFRLAPDKETFFRAYEEEGPRAGQLADELGLEGPAPIQEHCTEHKDNIYILGPRTGMQVEGQGAQ